ncbi:hypothetical protein Scep_017654 [Stephania cephalantha]|uniref:Uncharacterized protein n=1 Tax=Stephania cephalantha TaxID=152367 RepID=A0AAP0NX54_9MAGN
MAKQRTNSSVHHKYYYSSTKSNTNSAMESYGLASSIGHKSYRSSDPGNGHGAPVLFTPTLFLQQSDQNFKPSLHLVDPDEGKVALVDIEEGKDINERASSFIQGKRSIWAD